MSKHINIIGIVAFFILGLFSLSFAEESITITTYYPSPYGSYKELTAHRMKIGTTYSGSGTTVSDNDLIVEGKVSIGTTSPRPGAKLDVQNGDIKVGSAVTIKGDGSISTGLNAEKVGGYVAGTTAGRLAYYNTNGRVVDSERVGGYTAADLLAAGGTYQGCWSIRTTCTGTAAPPIPGGCIVSGAVEVGYSGWESCGWGNWAGIRVCCLPK